MQQRIINLGKSISEEFEKDEYPDTLSRWMSHYIAQLIIQAENSTCAKKKSLDKECFDTILKLWEYNSTFPDGKKPFERFDNIIKTLERLNPDYQKTYYYEDQAENDDVNDDVMQLMKAARVIDATARVWLEEIFEMAIEFASDDKTKKWLNYAIPTKRRDVPDILLKILGSDENNDFKSKLLERINHYEDSIEVLNNFKKYNEIIYARYTNQLAKLKSVLDNENDNK